MDTDRRRCAQCGLEVDAANLVMSDVGEICLACEAALNVPKIRFPFVAAICGLLPGVIPFFLHHPAASIGDPITLAAIVFTGDPGHLPLAGGVDFVGIGGGILGALVASGLLFAALRVPRRWLVTAVATAILGLGVYQTLYGFGLIS